MVITYSGYAHTAVWEGIHCVKNLGMLMDFPLLADHVLHLICSSESLKFVCQYRHRMICRHLTCLCISMRHVLGL